MSSSSGALEEILAGLTGVQRQRVRAVLAAAEDRERPTVAAVRDLADRSSGQITLAGYWHWQGGYRRFRAARPRHRVDHR